MEKAAWVLHGVYNVEAPPAKDPNLATLCLMLAWRRLIKSQLGTK